MRVSLLYAMAETASWKKRWALVGGAWDMRVSLLYTMVETASWKKRWTLAGGAWDEA